MALNGKGDLDGIYNDFVPLTQDTSACWVKMEIQWLLVSCNRLEISSVFQLFMYCTIFYPTCSPE